jgi:DNA invertase Pin-like site-specific DNA recombinase
MTIPRILGYARVSTEGQDLHYQLEKLRNAGCCHVFHEKRSGKSREERPQLDELLKSLRSGDLLLATTTDRIARDPVDLLNILHTIKQAGACMRLLDEPVIDTTSEMADLVIFLVGWAARWQRKRILENTARGRELARERGVKFGRKSILTEHQKDVVRRKRKQGETPKSLANLMSVSRSTIYRVGP